jgi:hypothetical protein
MPTRMKGPQVLVLGALAALGVMDCARRPPPRPPPCVGAACRQWPHVTVNFWRGSGPPRGRRYTGALCVQVNFDCPEEGRHAVWIEPEAPRCTTYLNSDGPEWLRVENGRIAIPWPARCQGNRVEMYLSAQPNFALCSAVNNRLIIAQRDNLQSDLVLDCR